MTRFFAFWVAALGKREDGETMTDCGMALAVIALGVVVAVGVLSGAMADALARVTGVIGV